MWRTAEKRFVGHVCLRNLFLPFLFGIQSIHPLPEAYCIMPIPSLQLEKINSPVHRNRGFGHWVVVSKISYNAVIVLLVVLCDCCKPMIHLWEIELLATVSWTCGCQPFQLPMFAKCDALPKGDLLDMFVKGILSRYSFREFQASTSYQKLDVLETGGTLL